MSGAAFCLRGFTVSLLSLLVGSAIAQEDVSLSQALSLVKASLECPAEQYTPDDAPFDHRLDRSTFSGNATTFLTAISRDHLLTWPGSKAQQWHDSVQSSIAYSEIGSIEIADLTVKISCEQTKKCVQTRVDRSISGGFSDSEDHINVKASDLPTAENLKIALDFLKSIQK